MEFLRPLKDVILSFTNKELLLWIYGYLAAVVFMAGLYLFLHTRSIQEMHVQYQGINKSRKHLQVVLSEYQAVKQQQLQVDEIVKKDKNFYLKKYYQDLIASVGIIATGDATISDQKLENG